MLSAATPVLAATFLALSLPLRPTISPPSRHAPCRLALAEWGGVDMDIPSEDETELEEQQRFMENSESSSVPLANRTVAQLKQELRQMTLKQGGSKAMLIDRIQKAHVRLKKNLPLRDSEVTERPALQWYMLQTANGFEASVARTLTQAIQVKGLSEDITKIWVPLLAGETTVRDNSIMPSYIFVRMRMTKSLHSFVKSFTYVVNFVGADFGGRSANNQMGGSRGAVNPLPVSEAKMRDLVAKTKNRRKGDWSKDGDPLAVGAGAGGAGGAASIPLFEVDQMVEVTEGPFKGLQGPVRPPAEGAAAAADVATVALTVMGRETPVELPTRHLVRLSAAEVMGADWNGLEDDDEDDEDISEEED